MHEETRLPFSSTPLDEETRLFVEQTAKEIHGLMRRTVTNVIRIGEHLLSVKTRLLHGQFGHWRQEEFEMTERQAQRFITVAERFASKADIMSVFPVTILYELASPSTPETVIDQVVAGQIEPSVAAVREARQIALLARDTEQWTRAEQERIYQLQQERDHAEQERVRLARQIDALTHELSRQHHLLKEASERDQVPPEVERQRAQLQEQLAEVTRQRDELASQVKMLGEQAQAAILKRGEEEGERRIRLNWYRVTTSFRTTVLKLLAEWPSSLDTLAFEAEDWTRLAQTRELAEQVREACRKLTREIESAIIEER